jgi:hypothetical protein
MVQEQKCLVDFGRLLIMWSESGCLVMARVLVRATVFLRIQRQEAQPISEYTLSSVSLHFFITSDVIAAVSNRAHIGC